MRLIRTTSDKHSLLVRMVRAHGDTWGPAELRQLILGESAVPDATIDSLAHFVGEHSELIDVSDAEFIAAVHEINPKSAQLLASHQGLAFLHKMSAAIAARRLGQVFASFFGRD